MKKIVSAVCGLLLAGSIISCNSNAGQSNGSEQKTEPQKTEQTAPKEQKAEQKSDAPQVDLTKKYICPNRDFSTDEENATCPNCQMEVIPN
ncbi:MAG: hypothetical protein IIU11_05830 [Bacteroidales bacterium]|jgi:hypothetical protein|nr:hypothetical protein [Bacteroidales bacterium]